MSSHRCSPEKLLAPLNPGSWECGGSPTWGCPKESSHWDPPPQIMPFLNVGGEAARLLDRVLSRALPALQGTSSGGCDPRHTQVQLGQCVGETFTWRWRRPLFHRKGTLQPARLVHLALHLETCWALGHAGCDWPGPGWTCVSLCPPLVPSGSAPHLGRCV